MGEGVVDAAPPEGSDLVASIEEARARKFLTSLKEDPFLTFVFREGRVDIYVKGVHPDSVEAVAQLVEQLEA